MIEPISRIRHAAATTTSKEKPRKIIQMDGRFRATWCRKYRVNPTEPKSAKAFRNGKSRIQMIFLQEIHYKVM